MGSSGTLRIAVITDLHVGGTTDSGFQNSFLSSDARETVGPAVDAVNRESPDLVLVTGDLTHNAAAAELAEVRAYLDRLTAPFIVCRGNHDSETADGVRRFDETFAGSSRAASVRETPASGASDIAVFGMESTWEEPGPRSEALPPLARTGAPDIETALADLERIQPTLLLVLSHYPLISQADYVASVGGKYAGHVAGGDRILESFTERAGAVICFTGHNHYHHIMTGDRWLQLATGAIAEYPSEFRMVSITAGSVTVETVPAAPDLISAAPPPPAAWVAGRPEDRDSTWRPGPQLRR